MIIKLRPPPRQHIHVNSVCKYIEQGDTAKQSRKTDLRLLLVPTSSIMEELIEKRKKLKSSKTIASDKPEKPPVAKNDCVVKSTDMSEELQKEVLEVAMLAMNKFRLEKDMATYIKEEFDRRHDPSWHCVVGKNFGSFVTHEINHFIYLYVQHIAIMLFKTGF